MITTTHATERVTRCSKSAGKADVTCETPDDTETATVRT
jgi:hypothetical protein